jgi:hypothetical protein
MPISFEHRTIVVPAHNAIVIDRGRAKYTCPLCGSRRAAWQSYHLIGLLEDEPIDEKFTCRTEGCPKLWSTIDRSVMEKWGHFYVTIYPNLETYRHDPLKHAREYSNAEGMHEVSVHSQNDEFVYDYVICARDLERILWRRA